MSNYRVAPNFVIRAAGVSFDPLAKLATSGAAAAARVLLVRQSEFEKSKVAVELLLRTRGHGLSEELLRAWRKAIRSGTMPPATDQTTSAFAICWQCAQNQAIAEASLNQAIQEEIELARSALLHSSRRLLPPYLLFGAGEFHERLKDPSQESRENGALPPRNARTRDRERHLLLYLQRICAKNDTFSQFGPSSWGRIDAEEIAVRLGAETGVARRDAFLERWTAHVAAASLNHDPEIRPELAPRLNPNGRLEGNAFVLSGTNETILLDPEAAQALRRCDGRTAAHALRIPLDHLEKLARENVIRWQVEIAALEPHAFTRLMSEIEGWRPGAARDRWLNLLSPLAALPGRFAQTADVAQRIELMSEARHRLENLGFEQKNTQRFLYAAANPIAEECSREGDFVISESMADQFVREAEPWIDLWRDTYAFVASRVAIGLRRLLESMPARSGSVPLPAFLQHCAMNQMPLERHGAIAFAHAAFQEVKSAFRKRIETRVDVAELELTTDDCRFVRQDFEYPKFDEYTYPSADLQISARSIDAVTAGDYQWVLAELHPPLALLHHCFYWSCPDRPALSSALASTTFGRPSFHFGFFAADFTAHTTVRVFDALPEQTNFVAPQLGNPKWKTIAPSETEVYVDERTGDVCLRRRDSHEELGSFARAWLIPLGFHPFHFGRAPHMPRLRCGNVIVQRRSWTVVLGELGSGNFSGVSRDLLLAIERLRAERDWPRHVYIRPTEQALRRSGAEGRDKDTKPVFIDLESYLSLEILHRWLSKSGELEVTEMLPDAEHLCWHEPDGGRTFELRTLIVPR